MGLHFDIVDVFTDRPYAGNPLAVVHRARTLTARQMQALAAEFGLSETAFTLPPTTSRATYRLRIFTPTRELPFAGHPSIGAAWALAFADMIRIRGRRPGVRSGAAARARRPGRGARRGRSAGGRAGPGRRALAATVGLTADDLDPPCPPGVAAAGVPFAFLPVRPDAVARAVPDPAAVAAGDGGADRGSWSWPSTARTARRTCGCSARRSACPRTRRRARRRSRSGVHLAARGALPRGRSVLSIAQGAEMGRPSTLELQVRVAGGAATEVAVRGEVRMVAKGELLALPGSP